MLHQVHAPFFYFPRTHPDDMGNRSAEVRSAVGSAAPCNCRETEPDGTTTGHRRAYETRPCLLFCFFRFMGWYSSLCIVADGDGELHFFLKTRSRRAFGKRPPANGRFGRDGDGELLVRASAVLNSEGPENWPRGRPGPLWARANSRSVRDTSCEKIRGETAGRVAPHPR